MEEFTKIGKIFKKDKQCRGCGKNVGHMQKVLEVAKNRHMGLLQVKTSCGSGSRDAQPYYVNLVGKYVTLSKYWF